MNTRRNCSGERPKACAVRRGVVVLPEVATDAFGRAHRHPRRLQRARLGLGAPPEPTRTSAISRAMDRRGVGIPRPLLTRYSLITDHQRAGRLHPSDWSREATVLAASSTSATSRPCDRITARRQARTPRTEASVVLTRPRALHRCAQPARRLNARSRANTALDSRTQPPSHG